MKEQGLYEEHYFISGTTHYACEGYKIEYNNGYYISCSGYMIGKFSGRKVKIFDYPVKSLTEAKHYIKKLKENKKKFNFNLAGKK